MTNKIFEKISKYEKSKRRNMEGKFKQILIAGNALGVAVEREGRISVPKRYVPKQPQKKTRKQAREIKKIKKSIQKGEISY